MVKVDKSELEEACQLARSFPDMSPPVQSYYIGCKKQGDELYLYWKDKQGRYWYETKSAQKHGFQNRTVQGGIFMPLLLRGAEKREKQQ